MIFRLFTASVLSPLAIAGTAGIAGAATASPAHRPPRAIVVQQSQDGQVVQLQRSQRLVIRLPSNPSTGYDWQVVTVSRTVLRQGAVTFVGNPNPRGWVGVGGVDLFRFRAIGAGNTQLRMAYRRWWERSQRPGRTFRLRVIVHR